MAAGNGTNGAGTKVDVDVVVVGAGVAGLYMQNALPVQLVEPEDIANAAAWLCSDEARYITGVTLPVDAGFSAK